MNYLLREENDPVRDKLSPFQTMELQELARMAVYDVAAQIALGRRVSDMTIDTVDNPCDTDGCPLGGGGPE